MNGKVKVCKKLREWMERFISAGCEVAVNLGEKCGVSDCAACDHDSVHTALLKPFFERFRSEDISISDDRNVNSSFDCCNDVPVCRS